LVFPSNATGHVRHGKHIYCKISNSQSIVAKCLAADEQTKTFLERKYGRKTLQCLTLEYEDEKATEKWKSENTVACPQCLVNVEKSYGCNVSTFLSIKLPATLTDYSSSLAYNM
jgi:hypothetical protein